LYASPRSWSWTHPSCNLPICHLDGEHGDDRLRMRGCASQIHTNNQYCRESTCRTTRHPHRTAVQPQHYGDGSVTLSDSDRNFRKANSEAMFTAKRLRRIAQGCRAAATLGNDVLPPQRATPWGSGALRTHIGSVQRTNNSLRIWRTIGPLDRFSMLRPMSPGRCPGLGEPEGLRPANRFIERH
jgi:hypothetical protein